LSTAALDKGVWKDTGKGPGSTEAEFVSWLTISDQADSVRADVSRIRNHPLVPHEIPIYGYLYDVKTGRLNEVTEATQIGFSSTLKAPARIAIAIHGLSEANLSLARQRARLDT
jgi:carbonic anhydrase